MLLELDRSFLRSSYHRVENRFPRFKFFTFIYPNSNEKLSAFCFVLLLHIYNTIVNTIYDNHLTILIINTHTHTRVYVYTYRYILVIEKSIKIQYLI